MPPREWCSIYVTWNFFCPEILPFWTADDFRDLLEINDTVNSQVSLLWSGHNWTLFLYRRSSPHIIFLQKSNSDKICLSSKIKSFQNQKLYSKDYELPMADLVRLVACLQHFRATESLFLWISTAQIKKYIFLSFPFFHLSITFWIWISPGRSCNIKLLCSPKIFFKILESFLGQMGVTWQLCHAVQIYNTKMGRQPVVP